MAVLRIVPNLAASDPAKAREFYGALLGLDVAMDLGWIMTFASDAAATPQISVATEGGSGTAVPDLSIEVDDVDEIYKRRGRPDTRSPTVSPMSLGAFGASTCVTPSGKS